MRKLILILILLAPTTAVAGDCAIRVTRVPFEGKEEEALLKYKGQRTTAKMVQVDSVEECKKLAIAECHIDRVLLIKQKSVNAMFHLKNIDEGVDLCK